MEISQMQQTEQQDRELVEAVVGQAGLPAEIAACTVDFKEDHSGIPALYLSFQLKPDVRLDHETITRINHFISEVQLAVLNNGASRFPYASLDEAA